MATRKDACLRDPDRTAVQSYGGKRILMGYGNGSIFLASLPDFDIKRKLSLKESEKADKRDWKPLSSIK